MAKEFAKDFYNSNTWRKCAKAYALSKCYVCERCHNKFVKHDGGIDGNQRYIVHHKIPLTPQNINDPDIAYGWNNLMFLCIECHKAIHAKHSTGRRMTFDTQGNLIAVQDTKTPPY